MLLSSTATAQSISDRHWIIYRQLDGLASNDVYAIIAYNDTIWAGTADGVSMYNGTWKSYATALVSTTKGLEQVALGKVTAFALGSQQDDLWAGNETGMLMRWTKDGGWMALAEINGRINALASSGDALWIASDVGLLRFQSGRLTTVSEIGAIPVYAVEALDDVIWAGGRDAIWQLSTDLATVEEHRPRHLDSESTLSGPYTAIGLQSFGSLWVATRSTIFEYYPLHQEVVLYPSPFGSGVTEITAIEVAEQDSIWIASNGGGAAQFRLAGQEIASMRSWGSALQGGLTADRVRDIATDRDGSVWFATSVGVYRYQPWSFIDVGSEIDAIPVNDLMFDRLGHLWVATAGEGVRVRSDRYRQPIVHLPDETGLPGEMVYVLEQDGQGRIWAATNHGITYYESQRWNQPLALRNETFANVSTIRADALGLWIGTANGLLRYLFADGSIRSEALMKGQSITALAFDSIGQLWVATGSGALWLHEIDGQWHSIDVSSIGLPVDAPVTAFYAESEPPGSMLVAFKGGGIRRYQQSAWTDVEMSHKFSDQRVYALLADPATDSIWLGGELGLTRVDSYGVVRFDAQDGLQLGAVRDIVRDRDGGYWFGGDRGLTYYTPEHGKPWVQIAEVRGAEWQEEAQRWNVYTSTPVEIIFSSGDLQTSQAKLQLFTRLLHDDEDRTWQALPTKVLQLAFTEPGQYSLEYRVRDQALNYSPVQSMHFVVLPAPVYVTVPVLGRVESRILQLLILFGTLAIVGFGFVSYEILQHRRRVGDAVARGFNPYISGEPVRREDMFFGRHELLQRIISSLHNNSIMIHGERRIGKTTLLYQLAATLRQIDDRDYWFVALYIDLEGTTEEIFFHFLMEEIVHHINNIDGLDAQSLAALDVLHYHTLPANLYSDREFSRDLRQVIAVLEQYGAQHRSGRQLRLILLLDEMDTVSRFNHLIQQQLRRIFMREFAVSLGAVVAGIDISKEWERIESPWFNMFNEIAMQPFSRQESIQLLVEPVRGYYIYEPEALDFILRQCEGRPYRLQQYGLEAVNAMLRQKRRRITLDDALTAQQIVLEGNQLGVGNAVAPMTEPFSLAATSPETTATG